MEAKNEFYNMPGRIRFSETDENLQLSLYGVLNYFQDAATFHGEDVGFGYDRNKGLGIAWVVADTQLKVCRYPRACENIEIHTWPVGFKGMIGLRDYEMVTTQGEVLARGSSNWVLMDMIHGKPVHIPSEMGEAFGEHPDLHFAEDLGKRKIRMPEGGESRGDICIQESHLDANRHMNNAQYVRLAAKELPADFEVAGLRVEWKKQAHLGDVMHTTVAVKDGKTYVRFTADDGEVFFICECTPAVSE